MHSSSYVNLAIYILKQEADDYDIADKTVPVPVGLSENNLILFFLSSRTC